MVLRSADARNALEVRPELDDHEHKERSEDYRYHHVNA
jgi:hypothetical protein